MSVKLPIHAKFVLEEGVVVVIQKDPDSQGKEGSLWPERVILMDTRLPSRQKGRGTVKRGWGKGGQGGRECEGDGVVKRQVMKTIHPSPDVSDTGREKEVLKFWKLYLKCVNQSLGRGTSL